MRRQIDRRRENQRQNRGDDIGIGRRGSAEHDQIHLHGPHHPRMEPSSHEQAQHNAKECEEQILPVDIGRHFLVIEPQHLQGGQLPNPLRDVDVGQIIQHNEGECSCRRNNDDHRIIDGIHAVRKGIPERSDVGIGAHALHGHERLRHLFRLCLRRIRRIGHQFYIVHRCLAEGLLVKYLGHIDVVRHVALRNVRHGDLAPALPVQRDDIANLHVQQLRELLRNDNAVVLQGHRAVILPVPQKDERSELLLVRRRINIAGIFRPAGRALRRFIVTGQMPRHRRLLLQISVHRFPRSLADAVLQTDGRVIQRDFIELLVQNVENRIVNAKACDNQRRTAADSDDGHPEAPPVAEQIPHGHLPGKGEAGPDGRHSLQQHTLPGLGTPWPHQIGRRIHQRRQTGPQRSTGCAQYRRQHRKDAHGRLEPEFQLRNVVHDIEGIGNDQRDQRATNEQPKDTSRKARTEGIAEVFPRDRKAREAKGLQRTDLHSLILHHTGHGRKAGKPRHQEEDHRENIRQIAHPLRILGIARTAGVGVPSKDIPFPFVYVLHLGPGIPKLLLGLGDPILRLGLAVLIFLLPVCVFPLAVLELLQRSGQLLLSVLLCLLQLLRAALILGLSGGQLLLPRKESAACGIQLCLCIIQLQLHRVELRIAGGQLLPGRIQPCLLRRQLLCHCIVCRRPRIGSLKSRSLFLILRIAGIQCRLLHIKILFVRPVLRKAGLIFRKTRRILGPTGCQLLPCCLQLRLCLLQPLFPVRYLLPIGLLSFFIIRPAILQLLLGPVQLLPAIFELLLGIGLCLIQLLLGAAKLLLCLGDNRIMPQLCALLCQILQSVQAVLQPVPVDITVAVKLRQSVKGEINCREVIRPEIFRRNVNKAVHLSGPQRGAAAVRSDIQGTLHHADNRVGIAGKILFMVLCRRKRNRIPQLCPQFRQQHRFRNALIGAFRQPSLLHLRQIEALRKIPHHHGSLSHRGIQAPAPLGIAHAVRTGQRLRILLGQSQRGQYIAIHQMGAVIISIRRIFHVRRSRAKAGKKGRRQCRQHQNRRKAAEGSPHLADRIDGETIPVLFHHSISSIGAGAGFCSILSTLPFLI